MSSHAGIGSVNVTAWTRGSCRSRCWTSACLEMGVVGERVRAGVDGEPITFEAPLHFSVDPGALRVLVPEGLPADRQVAPLEAGLHAAQTVRRWLSPAL